MELILKKKSIHALRNTNLQATVELQSILALGKCSVKTVWKWDFFSLKHLALADLQTGLVQNYIPLSKT